MIVTVCLAPLKSFDILALYKFDYYYYYYFNTPGSIDPGVKIKSYYYYYYFQRGRPNKDNRKKMSSNRESVPDPKIWVPIIITVPHNIHI